MHRHRDFGQQKISRVVGSDSADAFMIGQFTRRPPSLGFQPTWEVGNRRDYRHFVSRATRKMRGPLINEDPISGVHRIGKQTRKGQDSQAGSLSQVLQFKSHLLTNSSTISVHFAPGIHRFELLVSDAIKIHGITYLRSVRQRRTFRFGSKLAPCLPLRYCLNKVCLGSGSQACCHKVS